VTDEDHTETVHTALTESAKANAKAAAKAKA
jgi:hypothetical protein